MAVALSIFGVAFAALCVWLTVRIVNRRERWAKRTLAAAIIGVPVLYVATFGPACWITSQLQYGNYAVSAFYKPLVGICWKGLDPFGALRWYARIFAAPKWEMLGNGSDYYWVPGKK